MRKNAVISTAAIAALTVVVIILLCAACGHRRTGVTQLTVALSEGEQPVIGQDSSGESGTGGVLPAVLELDELVAGGCKSVRNGAQVMSFGADYMPELSGTTSDREYSIEPSETSLKLRAYAPGDYAYAVYGQEIGASPEPLRTLIDSEVCEFGGGQDDDIPLIYYLGFADYSLGSWRWFGPFIKVDVLVEVNSAALKSRFKSPNDNYYLCVLTTNGSKAASALPEDGLVAPLPFEPTVRAASEDELDAGGITIETVLTDTGDAVTEPAVVTGLVATADASGVTLSWDANPDPFVFIYRVRRDDLDDEDPPLLLESVLPPRTSYKDETGVPGKQYEYSVRALKVGDLQGGSAVVKATRSLAAPSVTASDGAFSDQVRITWTAVEGAVGYTVMRADAIDGAKAELASVGAAVLDYNDYDAVLEQTYYYWVQALGEDAAGPLGGPDTGFCIELEPVEVTATDGAYPDRVELVWGEEPAAESYNVYRDTDEEEPGAELIGSVFPPEHAYTDTTAPWDEQRFYFVKPVVGGTPLARGVGDWGNRGLDIPAGVTATKGTNANKITISWDAVNNATRYKVYRAVSPEDPSPVEIVEVASPATSCDDEPGGWSGTEGVHYFYFVAALHVGPDTERSDFGSDEGWRGIAAPATVTASNGTLGDRVAISWSAVSQATVYQVYRDGSPIGAPIEAPTTTYADYDTGFGVHHDYAVSAGITLGYGPLSAADEGWRGLLPPANVQASDGEYTDKIAVTWGLVNTASGYRIYRSQTDDDPSPPFLTSVTGGTTTSYDDTGAEPNTQYWYSVSAWITVQLNEGLRSADDVGTIGNKSPVASLSADPTEGDAPLTVSFDASDSYDDDGSIVKYEWDWTDDGSYDHDSATDPTVSHEYMTAGEYTCKLRVTDDDGAEDTASVVIGACKWWMETVDGDGAVGRYTSLAFDSSDQPHISYSEVNSPSDLKYAYYDGYTWHIDTVDSDAGNNELRTSLALDSVDNPHIAYSDDINHNLMYAHNDGGGWDIATVDNGPNTGKYPSIALNSSAAPTISYHQDSTGDLWFAAWNGSSWDRETIDSGGSVGQSTSLTYDSSNRPGISYQDWTKSALKYAYYGGSTWDIETVDNTHDVGGAQTSLAFDSSDRPAISYHDGTNRDLLFARFNGTEWDIVVVDSDNYMGEYSSLAFDPSDNYPSISYQGSWQTNRYLKFAHFNGQDWDIVVVATSGGAGECTSLAYSADGYPSISYYDGSSQDLRYAHYGTSPH